MQSLSKFLTFSGLTLTAFITTSLPARMVAEPVIVTEASRAATVKLLAQFQDARPRITVLPLKHGEIKSDEWWWRNYDEGQGAAQSITELLVNELVNDGSYSLLDGSQIDGTEGTEIDETVALEKAQENDVDAVLMGTITQFDIKESNQCISVPFRGRVCRNGTKATVKLNVRLIEPVSKTILFAAQGTGGASSNSFGFDFSSRIPDVDSEESKAIDEILSEATEKAVVQLVPKLAEGTDKFY